MGEHATSRYSLREEIANSVTHGFTAVAGIVALVLLVVVAARTHDPWRIVAVSIYGASLVLLFAMSALYHAFTGPRVKGVFRRLDHTAIFLLIAGTYTPIVLVAARGAVGWTLFVAIWTLALGGILFELFFLDRFKWLTVAIYLGMGWLAVLGGRTLWNALSAPALTWLAIGGLIYTLGVVFYTCKRLPFNHAVWHLFVVGGSVCHFVGIYFHVLPLPKT